MLNKIIEVYFAPRSEFAEISLVQSHAREFVGEISRKEATKVHSRMQDAGWTLASISDRSFKALCEDAIHG